MLVLIAKGCALGALFCIGVVGLTIGAGYVIYVSGARWIQSIWIAAFMVVDYFRRRGL